MDHQIQHHIYIRRPGPEGRDTVGLDEKRFADPLRQGKIGRRETFQMSHLQGQATGLGRGDQDICGLDGLGDRFFDQ